MKSVLLFNVLDEAEEDRDKSRESVDEDLGESCSCCRSGGGDEDDGVGCDHPDQPGNQRWNKLPLSFTGVDTVSTGGGLFFGVVAAVLEDMIVMTSYNNRI